MTTELNMSIAGKDNQELFIALLQLFFNGLQPDIATADGNDLVCTPESISKDIPEYKNSFFLKWNNIGTLSVIGNKIVLLGLSDFKLDPKNTLNLLETLPFEIASFETLYNEWYHPDHPYEAPSFGNGHVPHGWACAFKGDGYNRLVSRRWLEFGPWKQHYGKNDTQLIQFHELNIENETALEQCHRGHILMGISDDGGFIQDNYAYQYQNKGIYDTKEKKVKMIVHGTDIPNRQLLDACAAKYYKVLEPDMQVDNVAYIFIEESMAEKHLHAIWLRGLECRTIKLGKEIILTDSYQPIPEKPAWVKE